MWDYTDKVKDHYMNPRNVGEINDADAVGEVGNIVCGDALKLSLKIDKKDERIMDAKFQTFGCGSAIASSSALTEMIKGKSLSEAEKITNQDIADYLGGLPQEKMHCSVMGREALEAAIARYRGKEVVREEEEGKLVCQCFGVTDKKIEKVIRENNLTTVEQVTNYTKAGGGCGACIPRIEDILKEVRGQKEGEPAEKKAAPRKGLTNIQKMQLIQETIEKSIRPQLQRDGGDIELIDIDGPRVLIALRGMCANCVAAEATIKGQVEARLREFVDENIIVEEVK
ncbi:MAG TPA: Fe-S cluster assembly protein NifU [Thermodesulfobacteriota bacterium]|nr:Fe-S cluster assembly protein NifU [Thermodesulfobacteriota bacterium]